MNLESINLNNIKNIETEEATKMNLIMPFIQQLGYNVFDITEVIPEYTADIAKRKGEKVDYAIKIHDKIAIIIEAKQVNEELKKHSKQLSRYFVNTEAKIGILSNGVEYWFYTDVDKPNIMDTEPFFTFNLLNYKEKDIKQLEEFTKDKFDENNLFGKAEEMRQINALVEAIREQMSFPSDELIKTLINNVYDGIKTQNVIQEYRELIITAFQRTIDAELVKKLNIMFPDTDIRIEEKTESASKDEKPIRQVQTTEIELLIYAYITTMFKDMDNITWKDNSSYFNILIDGKVTKWICRVFDRKQLKIEIWNGIKGDVYEIEKATDIFKYQEQITNAINSRIN